MIPSPAHAYDAIRAGEATGLLAASFAREFPSDTSTAVLEEKGSPGLDGEGTSFGQISTQTSLAQLYEHLIQPVRTEDADGVLVPDFSAYEGRLAESWEQNGLEWTWKLREGVISAAGNELTTKDVEYSLSRIKAFSPIPIGWFLMTVASILSLDIPTLDPSERGLADEFEAIDDYTFILRQLEPSPNLLTVLPVVSLGIFDSAVMLENATGEDPFSREWADQVGSAGFGAYSLTNWDKGASISMTVNPDYFRGEPGFKNLTFQRVPQSGARVTAIQSGDANVTTGLSPKEFNELDQAEEVDVLSWLGNVFVALGPNYLFEPWAAGGDLATSRLLRQAMAFAVPYDDIIEQDFFGQAIKWNGLISSKFYGAVDFGDRYTYDPARASELLAEAGFPNGEGLAGPGLTLSYIAEHASFIEPVANRIRTAFADVGIKIDLDPLPQTQFVNRETNLDDIPFSLLDQQVAIGPDAGYQSQAQPRQHGERRPRQLHELQQRGVRRDLPRAEGQRRRRIASRTDGGDAGDSDGGPATHSHPRACVADRGNGRHHELGAQA